MTNPPEPCLRPLATLPPGYSKFLGDIVAGWSLIEHILTGCVYRLLALTPREGRIAVREPRAEDRLTMIQQLAEARGWSSRRIGKRSRRTSRERKEAATRWLTQVGISWKGRIRSSLSKRRATGHHQNARAACPEGSYPRPCHGRSPISGNQCWPLAPCLDAWTISRRRLTTRSLHSQVNILHELARVIERKIRVRPDLEACAFHGGRYLDPSISILARRPVTHLFLLRSSVLRQVYNWDIILNKLVGEFLTQEEGPLVLARAWVMYKPTS